MQRAPANFERTNGGRALGWAWDSARVHLRQGPVVGAETRWREGPTAVLAKHLGGPRRPPIRSILAAWRPLGRPSWHGWPWAGQFPLSGHPLWESHLAICQWPCDFRPMPALLSRFIRADRQSGLCAIEGNRGSSPIYSIWFRLRHCEATWTHGSRNMEAWKHRNRGIGGGPCPGWTPTEHEQRQQIAAKSPKLSARMRGCRTELRFAMRCVCTPWPVGVVVEHRTTQSTSRGVTTFAVSEAISTRSPSGRDADRSVVFLC